MDFSIMCSYKWVNFCEYSSLVIIVIACQSKMPLLVEYLFNKVFMLINIEILHAELPEPIKFLNYLKMHNSYIISF